MQGLFVEDSDAPSVLMLAKARLTRSRTPYSRSRDPLWKSKRFLVALSLRKNRAKLQDQTGRGHLKS